MVKTKFTRNGKEVVIFGAMRNFDYGSEEAFQQSNKDGNGGGSEEAVQQAKKSGTRGASVSLSPERSRKSRRVEGIEDVVIFQATSNVTLHEQSIFDHYKKWMIQFSRVYNDDFEKEMRFKVFKKNLKFIENFNNMGNQSYKLGVNDFTDMTKEEFLATYTGGLRGININDTNGSQKNNETALLEAVLRQPISVTIDPSMDSFMHYKEGVFDEKDCGIGQNHEVALVGYGVTEDGIKYWLAKNSWGESWGEEGYMRIRRMVEWPEGMCGVAQYASYPVL
ncbi:hypothetical protein Bca101_058817 [Brassica carinata]